MVQQESAGEIYALLRPLPRVSVHLSVLGGRGIACLYPASFFWEHHHARRDKIFQYFVSEVRACLPAHMIQLVYPVVN